MSPRIKESTGVVQNALGQEGLNVLKRRVASNTEGERHLNWVHGVLGASAVYRAGKDDERYIVAMNDTEYTGPQCRTTVVFPESLREQVSEAIREAREKWDKGIGR